MSTPNLQLVFTLHKKAWRELRQEHTIYDQPVWLEHHFQYLQNQKPTVTMNPNGSVDVVLATTPLRDSSLRDSSSLILNAQRWIEEGNFGIYVVPSQFTLWLRTAGKQ